MVTVLSEDGRSTIGKLRAPCGSGDVKFGGLSLKVLRWKKADNGRRIAGDQAFFIGGNDDRSWPPATTDSAGAPTD